MRFSSTKALAALVVILAAGCASPEEREIARIEDDIRAYVKHDAARRERLDRSYRLATARLEMLQDDEVRRVENFRERLLGLIAGFRLQAVEGDLERMLKMVDDREQQLEIRQQLDRIETMLDELYAHADRSTARMIAVRTGSRETELHAIQAQREDKRRWLDEQRRAYLGSRMAAIAAIRGSADNAGSGPAKAERPAAETSGGPETGAESAGSPQPSEGSAAAGAASTATPG